MILNLFTSHSTQNVLIYLDLLFLFLSLVKGLWIKTYIILVVLLILFTNAFTNFLLLHLIFLGKRNCTICLGAISNILLSHGTLITLLVVWHLISKSTDTDISFKSMSYLSAIFCVNSFPWSVPTFIAVLLPFLDIHLKSFIREFFFDIHYLEIITIPGGQEKWEVINISACKL